MAFSSSDLTAIERAIAAGMTRVTFADGRSMEYGTPDALLRVRQTMKREMDDAAAKAGGTAARRGPLRVVVSKDL